ncbi:mas-related G-protein coupled receptor member F-like [Oenanthe melanoleuca]|uniref:mas-related G-protein coupled receptor member F-like n=1 Tax=Oenanthe melanoleuca TaxID=2939378 RepID=UPI0024C1BF7A|nr:mas-related G-protein coupled receptor member F-like [Oenanthe melanoleuca]XP_056348018.1 mas-related G-protein coupled receptor member F-like [Oenanthe melanoleuca]
MEVTTVSPSPASPTEGDDLCETDVTNAAIHSVTLLICLCGLAGNGAVLWLYSMESRTYAMFHLAVTDLLFLLFMVPSALLSLVEDVSCSTIVPLTYLRFLFQLSVVSYYWGLFRLMLSSSVFDMSNLLQFCYRRNLPVRLLLVVDSVQVWAFFALFTVIPMVTSLCPSHEQGQCRAALISIYAVILLLFAAPTVILSTINIIKSKRGAKKQKPKRRHIVVFIIVLFTLLLFFCNFLQQLGYFPVSSEIFFLLTCTYSSIKPFICFLAGRCWSPCSIGSLRISLQRVFEEKEEKTACSDDANTDTVI